MIEVILLASFAMLQVDVPHRLPLDHILVVQSSSVDESEGEGGWEEDGNRLAQVKWHLCEQPEDEIIEWKDGSGYSHFTPRYLILKGLNLVICQFFFVDKSLNTIVEVVAARGEPVFTLHYDLLEAILEPLMAI